jgi:hypothetical protein
MLALDSGSVAAFVADVRLSTRLDAAVSAAVDEVTG